MNIINLTPHTVNVVNRSIVSTGLARCTSKSKTVGEIDGINIVASEFGDVTGLPSAVDGTWLVVSRLVAAACPDRQDLLVPADLVRDDEGRVVGCKALEAVNGFQAVGPTKSGDKEANEMLKRIEMGCSPRVRLGTQFKGTELVHDGLLGFVCVRSGERKIWLVHGYKLRPCDRVGVVHHLAQGFVSISEEAPVWVDRFGKRQTIRDGKVQPCEESF